MNGTVLKPIERIDSHKKLNDSLSECRTAKPAVSYFIPKPSLIFTVTLPDKRQFLFLLYKKEECCKSCSEK